VTTPQYFNEVLEKFHQYSGSVFLYCSLLFILELFIPKSKCSLTSRFRGAAFWIVYILFTSSGLILWGHVASKLHINSLFSLSLPTVLSPLYKVLNLLIPDKYPIVVQVIGGFTSWLIVMQFFEFFYYWFHRLQHKVPILWRFHAVHHSLEEMSAFNSNHHISEEILRIPFVTIPLSLLVNLQDSIYVPELCALILGATGIFEHSCTRINYGIFRLIIPDNRYHRIHHSKDKIHFDKNFGSGSALWDFVFRTMHYPRKNEWPDVGLLTTKEPKNLREYLFRPFSTLGNEDS
jgi:sterol desaturase/sphingolipid hydroxylase (fatty acid hydroxylase superfamily)